MITDLAPPLRFAHRRLGRRLALLAVAVAVVALLCISLASVAYGGDRRGTVEVRVAAGDSLWSIAAARYGDGDLRDRVDQLIAVNHLSSAGLVPGQRLTLPPP